MVGVAQQPIEVFFSYSRKDKELRDELDTHLALLKRRGVTTWHDCQIVAGSEWEEEINRRIRTADIILLLISSDFIASNYCYEKELPDILKRHEAREAYVIPVLLRPVAGWKQSPFAKLQICPSGGLPVTQWQNRDAAFVDVVDSIEEAVNQLLEQRDRARQEQEREEQEKLRQEAKVTQVKTSKRKEQSGLFSQGENQTHGNLTLQATKRSQLPSKKSLSKVPVQSSVHSLSNFEFEVISIDRVGREVNRTHRQAKYFWENLDNGLTLDMVAIPGGKFQMGSDARSSEVPIHQVTIPPFFMGKFAVTQAQYQAVVGHNSSRFRGENRPVEQVTWEEAIVFCQRLSERTGRAYRLPSEAEWEYACRAGSATLFYFGEMITPQLVNYNSDQTTDVGSFPPNLFGLYDMHGNISEWCQDHWHRDYVGSPADGSVWTSRRNNQFYVCRGGSWCDLVEGCRSAFRSKIRRDNRDQHIGFRVACPLS
jgi:formylglycine-generating enzyme required for sulfatase activity